MISKYKIITIVYGGSGRDLAQEISDEIERRHKEEFCPIKPNILKQRVLESSSIMNTVIDNMKESEVCVIILTFDDYEGTRIRQNVLIETGVAWTILGKDRLIFLSEKRNLPDDFPSNIKSEININRFDEQNLHKRAEDICYEMTRKYNIHDNRDILCQNNYFYDGNILDELDDSIFEKKASIQMNSILNEWKNSIKSYDFLAERIMYLAERIAFLPVFSNEEGLLSFLDELKPLLIPTDLDRLLAPEKFDDACKAASLINSIIEYTILKSQNETKHILNSPESMKASSEKIIRRFERISKDIENFINECTNNINYNWLLQILAYDYNALAKLKIYQICVYCSDSQRISYLDQAIFNFDKAKQLAEAYDRYSGNIWLGFIQYNLARVYREKLRFEDQDLLIDTIKHNLLDAIDYREDWYKNNIYKGVFSTALTYEYFLAACYDYELRNSIKGYSEDTPSENLSNVTELRQQLIDFCSDTELGQLYRMRDSIDQLISDISNKLE